MSTVETGKSIKRRKAGSLVVPRAWGRDKREWLLNGCVIPAQSNENILEVESGDDDTTLRMF